MRTLLVCLVVTQVLAGGPAFGAEPVVATVGSETVTLRQYNKILASAMGSNGADLLQTEAGRKQLLDDIIRGRLVLAAAKKAGIQNRPEVQQRMAQLRAELDEFFQIQSGEILGAEFMREHMLLADKEAEEYYRQHKAEFEKPMEVKLRQMLLASEAQARQMVERLRQGEAFGPLARQFSQDKLSALRDGEMDYVGRGQCLLGRRVEEAAFGLEKPGEVSAPIPTSQGYRVLQLVEKRAATPVAHEEVMFRIRSMLKTEKYDEVVQGLAKQIRVEVDYKALAAASTNDLGAVAGGNKLP